MMESLTLPALPPSLSLSLFFREVIDEASWAYYKGQMADSYAKMKVF